MANILSYVQGIFTLGMNMVKELCNTLFSFTEGVPDNPLLLLFLLIPLVGLGVGLFKRLINVN